MRETFNTFNTFNTPFNSRKRLHNSFLQEIGKCVKSKSENFSQTNIIEIVPIEKESSFTFNLLTQMVQLHALQQVKRVKCPVKCVKRLNPPRFRDNAVEETD
jgi:hypothetical protein